ncbi:hypothetical protein ABZ618_22475 [Streptomyces roseolus]|uniref:hypothetical protein n=1 Tax=Streptomyces roseolus TaxID=67358 RepID=UPI00340F2043
MLLHRRTRALRTAAVAAGTSVALLLPAAAAFADDAPRPVAGQEQADRGSSWPLADGSTARVRQTGEGSYRADVVGRDGVLIGTLTSTGGRPAYGENNGLHLVLRPDGSVSSWREDVPAPVPTPKPRPEPAPKPAPRALPTAGLADGTVATFARHAENGPRVQVSLGHGERVATVDPGHPAVRHHGWTYELAVQPGKHPYRFVVVDAPKQGGNSWVYDLDGKLVAEYHARKR